MAPDARKNSSLPPTGARTPPTAGFAQPAGYAGAEQCSANSPLRPWGGPAEAW